jgi:hypothetical protein
MSKLTHTKHHSSINPSPGRNSTPEGASFGADFIPFEPELRLGDELPRKRKRDEVDGNEADQRQPRLARYEDGSFTTPWMKNMGTTLPKNAAELYAI